MIDLLVILQNAYGVDESYVPTYEHNGFAKSVTGKRLKEMIPDGVSFVIRNATKNIGDSANSCFEADVSYLKSVLDEFHPKVVLVCGKVAKRGIDKLGHINSIVISNIPHPAYRALSKGLTCSVRTTIMKCLAK